MLFTTDTNVSENLKGLFKTCLTDEEIAGEGKNSLYGHFSIYLFVTSHIVIIVLNKPLAHCVFSHYHAGLVSVSGILKACKSEDI